MLGIGISTRNCEDTIEEVIRIVDEGLSQFFPMEPALIVVSDGFSEDKTREVAESIPTKAEKKVVTQEGGLGKGNGVKTALRIFKDRNVEAIALVDGDLTSIRPSWIKSLLAPIMEGRDLCVPFYLRHPLDGVITNQLAYPLTTTLYGKEVRQPIGGEFSFSRKFLERILEHPLFPSDFGIDIFLTTVGVAEGFSVAETVLGKKEHTSTRHYTEPAKLLVPMYYQVTTRLFELFLFYQEKAKETREVHSIPRYGEIPSGLSLPAPQPDLKQWRGYLEKDFQEIFIPSPWRKLFSSLEKEIRESIEKDPLKFPVPLWAECVFLSLTHYQEDKKGILDILKFFWEARYISLIQEAQGKKEEEMEEIIRSQIEIFLSLKRKYLC